MKIRKFHHKSRHGCMQCKARRVKCDEAKPVCSDCAIQGFRCSFLQEDSGLIFVSQAPKQCSEQHNETPSEALPGGVDHSNVDKIGGPFQPSKGLDQNTTLPSDERTRLFLIHHYTTSTHKCLSSSSAAVPIWRDLVPSLAFSHDFVLHGIFAVTATDLAMTNPSLRSTYSFITLRHYAIALSLFRTQLQSRITPDNIAPIFIFSCLLPYFAFGLPYVQSGPLDPLAAINDIFSLLRGTGEIVKNNLHLLSSGTFEPLMLPHPKEPTTPLSPAIESALSLLFLRNNETTSDTHLRSAYTSALSTLRITFQVAKDSPGDRSSALPFPILMPREVATKMREGEPLALVLLAHYAVILHWHGREVWLRRWGAEIVKAVVDRVGDEWRDCLGWVVKEVGVEIGGYEG